MEFLSVKLPAYSVQTSTLLQRELTTDSFWNMCRKLAVLQKKEEGKKKSFLYEKKIYGGPAS